MQQSQQLVLSAQRTSDERSQRRFPVWVCSRKRLAIAARFFDFLKGMSVQCRIQRNVAPVVWWCRSSH
jgi:hypothetical protein